jgi:hypothetical protein
MIMSRSPQLTPVPTDPRSNGRGVSNATPPPQVTDQVVLDLIGQLAEVRAELAAAVVRIAALESKGSAGKPESPLNAAILAVMGAHPGFRVTAHVIASNLAQSPPDGMTADDVSYNRVGHQLRSLLRQNRVQAYRPADGTTVYWVDAPAAE